MGTAFVILLLLVLCGFIAYIGDLLGRRFGKKRLSVLGMRPKHTAIVLTIATGVLIAAVTFGVALISVPGFLRVVTQGEKLAGQNQRLAANITRLTGQNQERERQNQELETRNGELQTSTSRLETEKGRLTATNSKLDGQNKTLRAQNDQILTRNKTLTGENQKLAGVNRSLAGENKTLQGVNSNLEASNRSLDQDNRRLIKAERTLERSVAGLRKDVSDLEGQAELFRETVKDYREADYVFRRDQQIEQTVILADPPLELLEGTVNNIVYAADRQVRDRSRMPNGKPSSTAKLMLIPHNAHGASPPTTEKGLRDRVVQQASKLRGTPIVLRVVADENCVRGRPVPARLEWYANTTAFRERQAIAQSQIVVPATTPGRTKMMVLGAILRELIYFLGNDVGPTATSAPANMIPSNDTVGRMEFDQLLPVCEEIYELGGRVNVVARARKTTYRAGPLLLDLDVEPMTQASGRTR